MRRVTVLAALLALAPTTAHAASAPDRGTAFEPAPVSRALYGTTAESTKAWVTAHDGVKLFVEAWLPAAKDGNAPPARLPTILVATPYAKQGVSRYEGLQPDDLVPYFTARGYAVAITHVRGTGESGGCLEQTSTNQIDDTARVIEYLGRYAPWSDGNVGMYGKSYDGETQVSTAALGDRERTRYLRAIVPIASVGGQYEYSNMDGVPFAGQAALSNATYLALTSMMPGETTPEQPTQMAEKLTCVPELTVMAADPTGDLNPVWATREYRPGAQDITAATLWVHGLSDFNVLPVGFSAFFDRLPESTPKAGLFGVWQHEYPDSHAETEPTWERRDFFGMVLAWYDRYLKGLDSGVESWPVVQVQDNTGQWRAEPEWPQDTGAPAGQLELTGGSWTAGASEYVYESPAAAAPLHLSGVPVADLFLTSTLPTAQVVARLEVLDADGGVVAHGVTHGARSLRHLDPMPDGYFAQTSGTLTTPGETLRVPVRFLPTDFVVPRGGRLRLTLAGTGGVRDVLPSGLGAQVEVLAGCEHPSALRFLMPRPDAPLLNVREADEGAQPLASKPAAAGVRDGGGLATAPLCGQAPFDPHGLITGALPAASAG